MAQRDEPFICPCSLCEAAVVAAPKAKGKAKAKASKAKAQGSAKGKAGASKAQRLATELEMALQGGDGMQGESREAMHGRWITNATASIFDEYFWAELHLQHIARKPIASYLHAIQKDGSMFNVVTNLATSIRAKFEYMMSPSAIYDVWAPMLALVPEDEHEHWLSRAFAETAAVEAQVFGSLQFLAESPLRVFVLMRGTIHPADLLAMRRISSTKPVAHR